VGTSERGAVTVEAAIALAGLALVTVAAVGAVATAANSVRCVDAARELARLSARGEAERGRTIAQQIVPEGATIELVITGDEAVAEVSAAPLDLLPLRVGARAVAALEPSAVEEPVPVGTPSDIGPTGADDASNGEPVADLPHEPASRQTTTPQDGTR